MAVVAISGGLSVICIGGGVVGGELWGARAPALVLQTLHDKERVNLTGLGISVTHSLALFSSPGTEPVP
jgi:hypothetical protein